MTLTSLSDKARVRAPYSLKTTVCFLSKREQGFRFFQELTISGFSEAQVPAVQFEAKMTEILQLP
jgi:hypothetical protein